MVLTISALCRASARLHYLFAFCFIFDKQRFNKRINQHYDTADHNNGSNRFCENLGQASVGQRVSASEVGFTHLAKYEAEHERRYLKLLSRLTDGNFFKRDGKIWWQCRNCGFVIEAEEAPKLCPACKHPQAYFEPKKENY